MEMVYKLFALGPVISENILPLMFFMQIYIHVFVQFK